MPGSKFGAVKDIRPIDDMQRLVLGKESVKEAMAAIVREKISYYRGTLQMYVDESKFYKEVENEAKKSLNTIMANYNHKALTWFAKFMKALTQSIYSKIVVNEEALKRVRATIEQRKGPVIFTPTHRSYVDFLLVSSIVFYYNI